eukprot:TRINITY_DN1600_c0_g2_i1.p1 TRINITY_DN1600_c0_g2~~TRINITY_DN1600_c0_g2_i1.p1  ORF type:complete len:409 (+),score=81.07 TRINITY_DN1600_c0_g2_i1:144-1370(+)
MSGDSGHVDLRQLGSGVSGGGMRPRTSSSTVPILFPSGEDANPMNRRLPAEVVTRRRREVKRAEEKVVDEVIVDLKVALGLKPEARLKWLSKACRMADEGRTTATELYDVVSSRKFVTGMQWKVGRKALATVQENFAIFSEKQQRYLRSEEWAVNAHFGEKAENALAEKDCGEDEETPGSKTLTAGSAAAMTSSKSGTASPKDREPKEAKDRMESSGDGRELKESRVDSNDKGGVWMVAEDSSARQRAQAMERVQREATQAKHRAAHEAKMREEENRRIEIEAVESRKRALENEVDSSLMLLERLGKRQPSPPPSRNRVSDVATDRRGRHRSAGMSRSRSISIGGGSNRSRSRDRKRRRSRSGRRSRERRRPKVDFNEALRRRMQQRETEVDSARIPVVDPSHARRWK